jgi:hypothetical protein
MVTIKLTKTYKYEFDSTHPILCDLIPKAISRQIVNLSPWLVNRRLAYNRYGWLHG